MKTILMATAATLFAAGTAMAADTIVIVDTDGDGMISTSEYQEYRSGTGEGWFGMWDADQDGMLSAQEFDQGMWTHYDSDADTFWSQDELTAWEEDQLRYDATRSGREVSSPDDSAGGNAGANQ